MVKTILTVKVKVPDYTPERLQGLVEEVNEGHVIASEVEPIDIIGALASGELSLVYQIVDQTMEEV